MNFSDSERVCAVLENIRYKKTSNINEADLIVVTMCSVRQSAVDRVQGLTEKFEKLKYKNHKLQTILTGCVLKKDRKIFLEIFDYIIDIKDIKKISEILNKKIIKNTDNYLDITPKYSSKFSASVPIMTGCNNFCAYCVVPYVREREISRPTKEIVFEVKNLVKKGYKEIWLLGQNVNSYKSGKTNFPALLKTINKIPGKFWIRFTSSHPKDFNSEVIAAIATGGKITPYLNLPIQSGDDKVLKNMNRHYTVKDYKNKIKELRKKIPAICLSTDIIVGYPGETKKQFENTLQLFRDIKYDMAYINKYSERKGTAAAKLKDNVSVVEKKRREKALNEVLKQTALENNKKFVGREVEVLVDSKKGSRQFGRTKEYKIVEFNSLAGQANKNLIGKFIKLKIVDATPWKLKAKIK